MFVQIIQGRTSDREGLKQQLDRWQDELSGGAAGWLGSTGGVADDGTVFMMARFESEEAAKANSGRPEQGAWWNETVKYFDGEPTFRNSTDVDTTGGGGSDDAGFVQVMQGRATDRARLTELEAEFMPKIEKLRPDVLGNTRSWDGDSFVDVIYFTSEAEARKGEQAMSDDTAADMEGFNALIQDLAFIDIKDPWLRSP